jgi:hypothetical protein
MRACDAALLAREAGTPFLADAAAASTGAQVAGNGALPDTIGELFLLEFIIFLESRAHIHLSLVLIVILLVLGILPVCFLHGHRRRGRSRVGLALGIGTCMIVHNNGVIHFSGAPRSGNHLFPRHFVRVSESIENKLRLLFATQNALLLCEELYGRCLLETKVREEAAVVGPLFVQFTKPNDPCTEVLGLVGRLETQMFLEETEFRANALQVSRVE